MVIQVNEGVRITVEGGCHTLEQRRVVRGGKQAGKVVWDAIGHHGTLRSALRSLLMQHVDLLTGEREVSDVAALARAIDRAWAQVLEAVRP